MAALGLARRSVSLSPYDERWPRRFEQEAGALRDALDKPGLRIEHIGSTAIPGMPAKPIIDMILAIHSFLPTFELIRSLGNSGYEGRGDGGVADRLFFAKGPPGRRTHHLSVCEEESAFWRNQLVFRDFLRSHTESADRYAALKVQLASAYGGRQELYTEEKSAFVAEVLAAATRRKPQNARSEAAR
jgi:GrpB-like predicted nucleotidyltransferase (UPF0157 family)